MRRQPVGSSTLAQQRDIAERRSAIDILALSHVGNSLKQVTVDVLRLDQDMAITPPRDSLSQIQTHKVAPRDAVEHAPDLSIRVKAQVCWRGLSLGPAYQIEAYSIAVDAAGAALKRLDGTSDPKGAVMHVGAVGEIPDLVVRPTWEAMATDRIIAA